ncbi:Serine/threonine-protein kinase ATM [Gryllus bimaculatus]|nr:Serine/threonine-protein kinase ATM [Gryllus bimaculatus]
MDSSRSRNLTQIENLERSSENFECSGEPKNPNQDRIWKVLNQTLINIWSNLDNSSEALSTYFGSIMKTPMQFILFVVPQCHCCNIHFSKKADECLAFDTWLLGRMLCVLSKETLTGVHEAALKTQIQILNLLFVTYPPLYLNIIKYYLLCMQDLMEVEKGNISEFPLPLRHFIPKMETFRDLELDLKPSFLQLHSISGCQHLLAYIMKVLQKSATGLVGLHRDLQQQLWGSICLLLSGINYSLRAEAMLLAAALINAGGLPPSVDSQIGFWHELWYCVEITLTSLSTDSTGKEQQQELIEALKALLSATVEHMHLVRPREREVLLTTIFNIMQSRLCSTMCGMQDSVSKFSRQVLENSTDWKLDKCSPQRLIDNFNEQSCHVMPGLKYLILHELQQHVPSVRNLYQTKHNGSCNYHVLLQPPTSPVCALDISPSWRQLWKHVLLASNKLNQDTIAAGCVLQQFQVCRSIVELSLELTAEIENMHVKQSSSSIIQFSYFGDNLPELAISVTSAVHHCRPSRCAEVANKVLTEALQLLGTVVSLPEAQVGVDIAEAMLSLPWLDPDDNCFGFKAEHIIFQIKDEYQPHLDSVIKQLCLSQLALISSKKHISWRQKIVEQCFGSPDLCASVTPVIPWLLYNFEHPVPSSQLMSLLSPIFQSPDSKVQLVLAKYLCAIVCSLSGNCVCVRSVVEGNVQRKLLCLLCHHENWLNSPFPYSGSLEGQLLCLTPFLQSKEVEVRRYVARALPTLAGHLSKFRHCCDLTSWMPLLLDEDREVRIEFAKHARWLVFDGCWIRDKEQVSKETGDEFIPLSQLDRHELSTSVPLLARFSDSLVVAARNVLKRHGDPRQESLVITVSNIGCIALDCVLLPSLLQLVTLAGHWRSAQAGLVKRCIRDIAHAHNVTPKDLFHRFKPELCKNMVLTAAWCHVGENGFLNTLTNLARQFDIEDARELVIREKETVLPPLIAVVLTRPSVMHVLQQVASVTSLTLKDLLQSTFQHIYPYIVVNYSEEFLSEFIEFFKKEGEIDDLNTFMAPFLKIIHNELLLHFEGHRNRVLKTLQWLARVDPTYRNPVSSPLSEEQIADFLQPRFLGVLTHLESCLTSETAAESVKVNALRSMPELIRLMGPRHISVVRFKVLATLRIALRLNHANFPHLTIAAWNAFVHSLDDTSLGPLLSTVFASLLPLLETYPKEVASVFEYIVVEKMEDLWPYFKELYFVPEHPALHDIFSIIKSSSKSTHAKTSVYSKIKEKLMYVVHDNVDVRLHALRFLTDLLNESHVQLNEALIKHERVEPCIIEMLNKLTDACKDPDERVKLAAAECLGKIGAVDPGMLPHRKTLSGSTFFANDVDNSEFAIQALCQLAKGFQDATDTRTVDAFTLSIQDLLKVYQVSSESSLWNSFSSNVQDIMRPLLKSSYKRRCPLTASIVTPVYGSEMGTNLQEWVTNWSLKLIVDMAEGRPRRVFESCVLAFTRDLGIALFFLPYILLHALTEAQNPERTQDEVLKEFQALIDVSESSVLGSLSSGDLRDSENLSPRMQKEMERDQCILAVHGRAASSIYPLRRKDSSLWRSGNNVGSVTSETLHLISMTDQLRCSRTAFQLIDFLWQWVRTIRMANKKEILDKNVMFSRVQGFLKRLCKLQIAQGNFECQEYARALVYLERYIKENPAELQNQLWFFEELYVHLDDPDSVAGTLAIQGKEPSLKQLARAHEVTGQYQNAAACYEEMAQEQLLEPEQVQRMVRCYLSLDQPFTALKIAEGLVTDRPEIAQDIHEQYAECLWRLHNFDQLENFMESPALANNTSWGVQIGRALLLLRQTEHSKLSTVLDTTLRAVVEQLSTMDRQHGVYFHGYDYIVKLHALYELKKASETLASVVEFSKNGAESACHVLISDLLDEWDKRIQIMKRATGALEPVLTLRRIVLEQAHSHLKNCDPESAALLSHEIGKCWLRSAKAARKENYYQQAFIYILNAQKYKPPALFVEKARLYWEKGDKQSAFSTLNRGLEEQFPDEAQLQDMSDHKRLICAKARLLLAQYNEQRLKVDSEESKEQYTAAVHACQQWERPLVELARFYDRKFQNMPDCEKDTTRGAEMQIVMVTYLGRSLQFGTKYIYQSMPRMLTLWLDYGNNDPNRKGLPPDFEATTKKLTDLISENYTSCYHLRAKRCQEILQHSQIRKKELNQLVNDYNLLTDKLIELTNASIKADNVTISSLAPQLPALLASPNFSEVVVPVDRYMKFVLPTSGVSKTHVAFPQKLIYLQSIKEKVLVLQSLQKPRKITFIGSDGVTYDVMCKPKDDLRKDFRLMEFNAVVNRLLHRDPQARQRELHIRTYSVVPLNEECGLVEWVSNLVCLRPLLHKMYRQMGVRTDSNKMKEMLALRNDPAKYRQEFTRLLEMHPPILSEWFFTTFPDTASWYLARTSYVRTCAVMSMVGYIVGLGDRHGENILLDECTGEVVHVDFNCLFNKGDNFDWPEIVPFRLTQNMVEAMGPLGIEGPFRRSCEVTLDVLRSQSDTLMSILRPFLYDPIISWKRTGGRRPQGEMTNESAVQNLIRIERRLQGMVRGVGKVYAVSLSAEGQANSLIIEATKFENLCRMYIGWGPYL